MAAIEVTAVCSSRERDEFIKFPWQIYTNDPAWVPPLISERKQFLDPSKHPFYEYGAAQIFLARRGGEIVGRIMASDDPRYNALHQTNVGCFGLFESIDNLQVAQALFKAAGDWLRGRGRNEVMGPIDYSTNYVCGLLIEGFGNPPTVLTGHNPPYYATLLESCGFAKAKDLYAWWFSEPENAFERLQRLESRRKHRSTIRTRPADLRQWRRESQIARQIYNRAWENNWGFVPFTEREFDRLVEELKPIAINEFAWIAERENQPVGFILCLPDVNVALRRLNGRFTTFGLPIGLLKFLYHHRKTRTVRLIALGVLPEFRRAGVGELLVLRIIHEVMIKRGYTGEMSLTLEDNIMINRFLEAIGSHRYKTYRIFRKQLNHTAR